MASALITLTTAGTGTGPFDLYSNIGGYASPFESGVDKSSLVSGYVSNLVPNGTTVIRVQSTSLQCTNYVDISVTGITTTTTTTTTTAAPTNSSLKNNSGTSISGTFVFSVKIGSGSFSTFFSVSTTIAPGATYNFFQSYYPGSFQTTGNTFRVQVFSSSGITSSNYIQMFAGSTSNIGFFSGTNPATAETFSSGNQFAINIQYY